MTEKPKIAFILNAFPVLSETFILKEVIGLRERGIDIQTFSLFTPKNPVVQDDDLLRNSTFYLLPLIGIGFLFLNHLIFLASHPLRYFSTLAFSVRNRESSTSVLKTLRKIKTDPQDKSVRQDMFVHFFLAVPLARKIKKSGARLINAHFADAAASFALITSRLLNVPYSITMHAYDIFVPQFNMSQKLNNAVYIFTCTKFNKSYLLQHRPELDSDKIGVVYHGIDVDRFVADRRETSEVPILLSVGRLVPKKGLMYLLQACLLLKKEHVKFHCKIIGNGPEREKLANFIKEHDLLDTVELLGSIPHQETIEHYKNAFAFVLPCIVEDDGNRDGIPNVIAEAMAMELPVVSTNVSGIPELVEDGKTGIVIPEKNPTELAKSLEYLLKNRNQAKEYGFAGRKRVQTIFESKMMLDLLYAEYFTILNE